MSTGNAILVGISGPSSSGKTTLARLLRDVLPNAFILHEDDFYKDDSQIPQHHTGVADWDCLGALDLPSLESALRHIKTHGSPPPDFVSKEDKNSVGQVDVDHTVVDDLTWRASKWMFQNVPPIAIIDGFLLYSEDMKGIRDLFDVKLFLKTDFATTKHRRENRSGYVTLQGFWVSDTATSLTVHVTMLTTQTGRPAGLRAQCRMAELRQGPRIHVPRRRRRRTIRRSQARGA